MSSKNIMELLSEVKDEDSQDSLAENLWQISCKMDDAIRKIENAKCICAVLANSFGYDQNDESGALWAATDIIEEEAENLENLSSELLQTRREYLDAKTQKKGKKK